MIRHGVMIPWIALSASHDSRELRKTINALDKAALIVNRALKDGIENYLEGPAIKPVFRKFN